MTGMDGIEELRSTFGERIPGFLISGDTNAELLREIRAKGFHLLHKPVEPMTLRVMLSRMLTEGERGPCAGDTPAGNRSNGGRS